MSSMCAFQKSSDASSNSKTNMFSLLAVAPERLETDID